MKFVNHYSTSTYLYLIDNKYVIFMILKNIKIDAKKQQGKHMQIVWKYNDKHIDKEKYRGHLHYLLNNMANCLNTQF